MQVPSLALGQDSGHGTKSPETPQVTNMRSHIVSEPHAFVVG